MKCNKCNQEIPDNSKFCLHCGAKIKIDDGIMCSCGYKNPLDARFCTECGKKIFIPKASISQEAKKINTKRHMPKNEEFHVSEYFSLVIINGKWGLKNNKGMLILPCIYDEIVMQKNDTVLLLENNSTSYKEYHIPSIYK